MKVTFTPGEYAKLLELVHVAMQVVNNPRDGESTGPGRYAALTQKLLELATPAGCADLVTVGSDGRLMPADKLVQEERLQKLLETYHNDTFWHELVTRLADRDLASEQTRRTLAAKGMPPIDAEARLDQIEDAYWDEFERNDLGNVVVLKGGHG